MLQLMLRSWLIWGLQFPDFDSNGAQEQQCCGTAEIVLRLSNENAVTRLQPVTVADQAWG